MLCFNHANVVTLRFYGSKLLSLFEKPINSSKTEFCLPLGQLLTAPVWHCLCGITQHMNTAERKKSFNHNINNEQTRSCQHK